MPIAKIITTLSIRRLSCGSVQYVKGCGASVTFSFTTRDRCIWERSEQRERERARGLCVSVCMIVPRKQTGMQSVSPMHAMQWTNERRNEWREMHPCTVMPRVAFLANKQAYTRTHTDTSDRWDGWMVATPGGWLPCLARAGRQLSETHTHTLTDIGSLSVHWPYIRHDTSGKKRATQPPHPTHCLSGSACLWCVDHQPNSPAQTD